MSNLGESLQQPICALEETGYWTDTDTTTGELLLKAGRACV